MRWKCGSWHQLRSDLGNLLLLELDQLYKISEIDLFFLVDGFSSSGQSSIKLLGVFSLSLGGRFLLVSHDLRPVFGGLPPRTVRGGQAVGWSCPVKVAANIFGSSELANTGSGLEDPVIASMAWWNAVSLKVASLFAISKTLSSSIFFRSLSLWTMRDDFDSSEVTVQRNLLSIYGVCCQGVSLAFQDVQVPVVGNQG